MLGNELIKFVIIVHNITNIDTILYPFFVNPSIIIYEKGIPIVSSKEPAVAVEGAAAMRAKIVRIAAAPCSL